MRSGREPSVWPRQMSTGLAADVRVALCIGLHFGGHTDIDRHTHTHTHNSTHTIKKKRKKKKNFSEQANGSHPAQQVRGHAGEAAQQVDGWVRARQDVRLGERSLAFISVGIIAIIGLLLVSVSIARLN